MQFARQLEKEMKAAATKLIDSNDVKAVARLANANRDWMWSLDVSTKPDIEVLEALLLIQQLPSTVMFVKFGMEGKIGKDDFTTIKKASKRDNLCLYLPLEVSEEKLIQEANKFKDSKCLDLIGWKLSEVCFHIYVLSLGSKKGFHIHVLLLN